MKTHKISRFTGFTTGNKVAITATIDRRFAEEGIRAFMQRKAVPSIYDPEREFKLFTKVVLEPMTVVAVEADLVIPATDSAQTGLEVQSAQTGLKVQGLASFVSYKANLGDVVRSNGSFGRVLIGSQESTVVIRVPPDQIPEALRALQELERPIRAVVCDAVDGLDIWADRYGAPEVPYYNIMEELRLTLAELGIDGFECYPKSRWLIPGSMPLDPSNPTSFRRRLLFACDNPKSGGIEESINLLSGAMF
jgi:hypothetical protein